MELGSQVGSTTNHYKLLRIQIGEDQNVMRAEPAGVIANCGHDEYQELTSKGFLPLTVALCTLDKKRDRKEIGVSTVVT